MNLLPLVGALVCFAQGYYAAEILGLFQSIGRSQWVLAETYLDALHQRGHHITVVTTFPSSCSRSNWTEILIANAFTGGEDVNFFEMEQTNEQSNKNQEVLEFFKYAEDMCHGFLKDENVQNLYKSEKKFDVVVMEFACTDCMLGYAYQLKAPTVALSSFMATDWMLHMMGNPSAYAYIPSPVLPYTTNMNFLQRLHNTASSTMRNAFRQVYYLPKLDAFMQTYLNDTTLPSLSEIERQFSVLLVNYHLTQECPRPRVPNMIEVGGLHIRQPKDLSQDLQKFLDEAEDGAIYFSMGSNVKSSHWPEEKRMAFLNVFSKLKQRVLWKWETETLPGQPPNVKIGKWLPQSDILAHKKIRAFITHGGLLSTQEAMARGVPLISIPVFADQEMNAVHAENQGFAIRIALHNISETSLQWALNEILNVPRYRERAQQLARNFSDRPMHPLDEAVYWTEYVIRYKGAPHLTSAALDLAWYPYCLIDDIVVVFAAVTLALLVVSLAIRAVLRLLCG